VSPVATATLGTGTVVAGRLADTDVLMLLDFLEPTAR